MTQKIDILIKNGAVLTFDEKETVYQNGAVAIDGGDIIAIGDDVELKKNYRGTREIDAAKNIVMPGLINAHAHAAMSVLRGYADDLPLEKWLNDHIFPAEGRLMSDDMVYWGSLLSAAEMIKSGITTVSDSYFFEGAAIRTFLQAGMRGICAQGLIDFPTPQWKDPKDQFTVAREFLDEFSEGSLVKPALFVHSAYTASHETYLVARGLCEEYGARLFTHLAETRNEVEEVKSRYGTTPVRYLARHHVLSENFTAVHGVWLDDEEIDIISDFGASVVHCPASNAKLGSGVAPVSKLLKTGVPVGLGTDGPASNNRQDLFFEMDLAAKLQKAAELDPTAMKAKHVLGMALFIGAESLGMEERVGCLKKGNAADVIIVDTSGPHGAPIFDYSSYLVYVARGSDVITTIIDGKVVYDKGKLLTIDLAEARAKVVEIAERLGG